jgi:transcriptional regulator with XRE-family HTH domain
MEQTRSTGDSPTIRKRALARKLTEHRQRRGLTTTDVQRRLGWSATKLNWIEKARWTESVTDSVADLCELYEIEGPERDALITLARQSRERGWWTKYNDVFGREELPGWEAGASAIWTFETAFIPGLLQHLDYIELITRAAGIEDTAEIRRHAGARTRRQAILTREHDPCRLHAVIDENALARITDPAIRVAQASHLIEAVSRPNITVQILPVSAGVYPVTSEAFLHLAFPDGERDIVYIETTIDNRMLEELDEIERYKLKFAALRAAATTPEETAAFLRQQVR